MPPTPLRVVPMVQRPPHLLDASMFWSRNGLGGVRTVLTAKRSWLTAHGWRHSLLAPGAEGPGTIDCGGVPIPASGGYRFVVSRRHAARLIEQAAPDIVEAADPYTLGWAVRDATTRLRVPAVAFCHSNLPALAGQFAGGPGRPLGRWAERRAEAYLLRLYAGFDRVLAPSLALTRQLLALGLKQAAHQPLGVDCSVFSPTARDPAWRGRLEVDLGLPRGTRLLVYAGRFAPEKNLGVLAAAVARLGPGHVLLAVGAGPRPPSGAGVRVLAPERDARRLAQLLANCDAFVHAGDQETFGLAALEAMACGTPVVVSAAGGLGELACGVGLTVETNRPDEWAAAIEACLADPEAPRIRDALARARSLDWQRVCESMERRYLDAMRLQRGGIGVAERPTAAQPLQP